MRRIKLPFTISSPFRRIYAKIFLWFCATILITLLIGLAAASLTDSQPFGRRWMSMTQDLYARSAVDFYRTGGSQGLSRYLDEIAAGSGIQGQLFDDSGHDVLGRPILAGAKQVLAQAQRSGRSTFRLGRVWAAASPVSEGGNVYIFVMEVHPARGFLDGTFINPMLPRLILGLLLVSFFCLLLARNITEPIRVLEAAATQLAAGSLSVRASPRIGPRKDELGRMALAFDRMAERIQGLIYAQQEMLGHVSHELRSPLTRIGVSLELLRRGESDSLNQMEADLDRMNQLIGKILEITRIDIRTHQQDVIASFETVELSTMLQEIAQDASFETQRIQNKRLLFEPDQSCMVSGDRELLRSACENVVRNALLYTPDDTAIYIRLSRDLSGDTAAIVVRDEGPGVPEDSVAHLFDPFYRVDHAQIAHPEGTGLGLAIAQRIVAMHGGKISARNIQPQGLEVSIVLPLASHK